MIFLFTWGHCVSTWSLAAHSDVGLGDTELGILHTLCPLGVRGSKGDCGWGLVLWSFSVSCGYLQSKMLNLQVLQPLKHTHTHTHTHTNRTPRFWAAERNFSLSRLWVKPPWLEMPDWGIRKRKKLWEFTWASSYKGWELKFLNLSFSQEIRNRKGFRRVPTLALSMWLAS